MGQVEMDRAAKVKQYRKKRRGSIKSRTGRSMQGQAASRAGVTAGCLLVAGLLAAFIFFINGKSTGKNELDYVSKGEFASLMSFLMDEMPQKWADDAGSPVTRAMLRDFVRSMGLSEAVSVEGGSEKLERAAFMEYYERILDYLDTAESVQKQAILLLDKDGSLLRTQDGELHMKTDSLQLKPFYTYQAYLMGQTVLGIASKSEKTIALRGAVIQSAGSRKTRFVYQEREYEIASKSPQEVRSGASCTLCIKDGRITSVKDIQETENKKPDTKQAAVSLPESVKVLILNSGSIHYDQVFLSCDSGCSAKQSNKKKKASYGKDEVIPVKKLKLKKGGSVTVTPKKADGRICLTDKKGSPVSKGYYGSMTVYRDKDGYYVVNKVPVEKYLYSVTASEMPSSFGTEALKAQAVCARSYVYRQMQAGDYEAYHAQIDDSTNYQVYNKSDISEEDVTAVEETAGEIMYVQDEIVNAYYFSSSHGYTSTMEIWNQDEDAYPYLKFKSLNMKKNAKKPDLSDEKTFRQHIKSDKTKTYDSSSRYYRWQARLEFSSCIKELKEKIQQRYQVNPDNFSFYLTSGKKPKKGTSLKGFGGIKKISCARRGKSGAVLELSVTFEFGRAVIQSEYNIRAVLGCAMEQISYADGTKDTAARFLPSSFFAIDYDKKSRRYVLSGGGNGHGMGMSQYGASGMAKEGWSYQDILKFFYDGAEIRKAA